MRTNTDLISIIIIVSPIIISTILIFSICSYFIGKTHEVKKCIKPEIRIESTMINGVMKSDTTYIYKF